MIVLFLALSLRVMVKIKSSTCYSASYMRRTRGQKRFTISEVTAVWHKLMIPQCTMRPSIAGGLQLADIPPPQSATLRFHVVACKLLLISLPTEGRRLSWPEHIVN